MRLSQILLISLLLFSLLGSYDGVVFRHRSERLLACLSMVALLLLGRLGSESAAIRVQYGCVFLAGFLALRTPWKEWGGIVIVSTFGGLLSWKLSTSYPLFEEQGLLIALVIISLAFIYCRAIYAKLFASACAVLFLGVFQLVQDYILFGYGKWVLGSDVMMDAQIVAVFVCANLHWLFDTIRKRRTRVRITFSSDRSQNDVEPLASPMSTVPSQASPLQ